MKNFIKYLQAIVIVSALLTPLIVMAQNQPDPLDKERKDVLPAYDPGLAQINQAVVDDKNAALPVAQAAAVDAAAAVVPVMPAISAPATTTANGTIVMTFTNGTILPSDLSGLWAKVTYNGKTEFWKLDPGMLAADGKSFTMQFGPSFANTTFNWSLYGFAPDGTQTNFTNEITFKVNTPGTVTMPQVTAPTTTTAGGQLNITFATPMLPSQLSGLWAKVDFDGKTEYWKLDPGMISADGKTFTIKFDPQFTGKTMTMALFGYAKSDNSQTNNSNPVTFTINAPGTLTIPAITTSPQTDQNGNLTISFASPLLPSNLSELWAVVKVDGTTQYWKLNPGAISADGKTLNMSFDKSFAGKQITIQLYGIAQADGSQTKVSNAVTFTVISAQTSVTMPVLPATVNADINGKAVITFASGTILPSQLSQFWAEVKVDGTTQFWNLGTGALSADGKSVTLQFDPSFEGKSVAMRIYGFDTNGVQTPFSNTVTVTIPTSNPAPAMPVLPATVNADVNGRAVITFASGTILPSQLNGLWAEVKVDGTTQFWNLGTGALAADGKSLTLNFDSTFKGKTVAIRIYGFDKQDKQTSFSNAVNITIPNAQTTVTMPVLPATVNADINGKAVITFASGTVLPSQLSQFWAEVKVDGTTQFWNLGTGALSADGRSLTLQFDSTFQGKSVAMRVYGFDLNGVQTPFSNTVTVTIPTSNPAPAMPVLPATLTADNNGRAVITFASGTILPSQLNGLWAEVKVDGTTQFWNIGTGALAADGKSLTLVFDSTYKGKTVAIRIYGFDKQDKQTSFSNTINITIPAAQSTVTMPVLPATVNADVNGKTVITFASGTVLPSQLSQLWAEVKVDGTTQFWNLGTGALSADGRSVTLQFDSTFQGKSVAMRLYGFDTNGVQSPFSNTVTVTIPTSTPTPPMPVLPATVNADVNGRAVITFASGTILPSQLNGLWAEVKVDGTTQFWNLGTGALAADGKSLTLNFDSTFKGKTVAIRIYGFDKQDKQTSFSNTVNITIPAAQSTVTMPVLPATVNADVNGKAVITFASGTVLPSQLSQLWAEVKVDGTTQFWNLGTGALSADGRSVTLQFDSTFQGKSVAMRLYGFDTNGVQSPFSNTVTVTIPTSNSTPAMPVLPATLNADNNGRAVITFASGTILPSQLNGLWAEVKVDGTTQFWNLGTGALAADGKSLTLVFDSTYKGKTVAIRIYGFDKQDKQTSFSNTINITVPAAQSTVTMPVLPATVNADVNGKAVITFASGTVLPSQLSQLWAEVKVDGTTQFWNLGTGALSADGRSVTLQFDSTFQGKSVAMRLYGFDTNGVQSPFSNTVTVAIPTSNSTPAMPVLPATLTTDNSGKAVITFASGTILPSQLSGLWAEVKVDGTTQYWNIGTGALAADGKSLTLNFDSTFKGKTVAIRIYGFDAQDKQTPFSNTVNITVASQQSSIVMPVIPSTGTTDSNGNATITFSSGTLLPSQLTQLWAEVTYDNKTEYWNIQPAAINAAGTAITLKFIHDFNGKTVRLRFYGFDLNGLQTLYTNPLIIQSVTS